MSPFTHHGHLEFNFKEESQIRAPILGKPRFSRSHDLAASIGIEIVGHLHAIGRHVFQHWLLGHGVTHIQSRMGRRLGERAAGTVKPGRELLLNPPLA